MKCDPATIAEICSRPGVTSLGIAVTDRPASPGKGTGDHVAGAGKMAKRKPRPRHIKGVPNKTEAQFAREVLEIRRLAGEITSYRFEPVCFDLSDRRISKCTYTPDWLVFHQGRIIAFDVKGGPIEGDAWIKMKWFANKYRHIPLYLCRRGKGGWTVERIGKGE